MIATDILPKPRRLPTKLVEKVWGRDVLPEPFRVPRDKRIGEVWFEPPAELPGVLVKYLFTSEKLSVQVHPPATEALAGEEAKEEYWLVLDAEPGARLAIGFDRELDAGTVEQAARDGSIEELLTWHEAKAGDFFYLPAGTVHAIGPGLSLVEVQQTSDTTFRLYDYGRPRELHLERAMAVASLNPYPQEYRGTVGQLGETLVDGPYFRLHRIEGSPGDALLAQYASPMLALPLAGEISDRAGRSTAAAGECLFAAHIDQIDFSAAELTLLTRA